MLIPAPSLSTAGWITSPADKADALMSHFFEAEKSQTFLYGDNVSSLQYVVEQSGHDPATMVQALRGVLMRYLSRYYEAVVVNVDSNDDGTPRYELRVFIQVTEEGKQYSFGKLLRVANSKISKIVNMNNDGY